MDETDKPLGFFDLSRELRDMIYHECGYYTLREGSPTLNLVEVELTKHCSPDLRLVSRQFKAEFEEEMSRQDGEDSLSICFLNTPRKGSSTPVKKNVRRQGETDQPRLVRSLRYSTQRDVIYGTATYLHQICTVHSSNCAAETFNLGLLHRSAQYPTHK